MTLVVETDAGVFVRHVPDASPLHSGLPSGVAAEEATDDAAAIWGMPDFVFKAALERFLTRLHLNDEARVAGYDNSVADLPRRRAAT